jgi:crotonobetainyl-CoA:carnitine CoA-transferase CaiB-like acyl-CoA transferase
MMSDIMLPLADVRIIAVEQFGAGPWATLQFADLGAEVIKIEHPGVGGDVGRYVPPYQRGEDSLFFETFNRNKKSVSLDIGHPQGRAVFEDLVRGADAVFSNLRGDQPAKLRLTYDDLKDVNPRVVCCSLSGFGMTGPRAAEGGYDYTIQGYAGWMSLTGQPGGPPMRSGISAVDLSGGYVAAFALLAGLWAARRDGTGCDCDISLLEAALAGLWYLGTWAATAGHVPERTEDSAHPSIVPFQNFATQDGWVMVGCAKEKFWVALCLRGHRPADLLEDPRYADFGARERHRRAVSSRSSSVPSRAPHGALARAPARGRIPHSPNNTSPRRSRTAGRGARRPRRLRAPRLRDWCARSPPRCASAPKPNRPTGHRRAGSTPPRSSPTCAATRRSASRSCWLGRARGRSAGAAAGA